MAEYIDREALTKSLEAVTNEPTCPIHIAAYIDQIIAQEPAADVVEVRHGFWEYVGLSGALWCSECKKQSSHMGYATNKFCPNCGAIMDKNKTDKVKIE